jgi:hypothetical protein
MEAAGSSETLIPVYKTTRRYVPQDRSGRSYRGNKNPPLGCVLSHMLPEVNFVVILSHAPTAVLGCRWHVSPKRLYLSTKLHGVTSQKI